MLVCCCVLLPTCAAVEVGALWRVPVAAHVGTICVSALGHVRVVVCAAAPAARRGAVTRLSVMFGMCIYL